MKHRLIFRQLSKNLLSLGLSFTVASIIFLGYSSLAAGELLPPPAITQLDLNDPQITERIFSATPKKIITVENDPLFGKTQQYEGYPLQAILNFFESKANSEIAFIASDGYSVTIDPRTAPVERGLLAIRVFSSPDGKSFPDLKVGQEMQNPGPFILVWSGDYKELSKLPVPWGVVEIKLVDKSNYLSQAEPNPKTLKQLASQAAVTQVKRGFNLFKDNCIKCHAVNMEGGRVGPELNVPLNITEYWRPLGLAKMIKNPADVRWGSKMPPFPTLSEPDIADLISYLSAMRFQKVCDTADSCNKYSR